MGSKVESVGSPRPLSRIGAQFKMLCAMLVVASVHASTVPASSPGNANVGNLGEALKHAQTLLKTQSASTISDRGTGRGMRVLQMETALKQRVVTAKNVGPMLDLMAKHADIFPQDWSRKLSESIQELQLEVEPLQKYLSGIGGLSPKDSKAIAEEWAIAEAGQEFRWNRTFDLGAASMDMLLLKGRATEKGMKVMWIRKHAKVDMPKLYDTVRRESNGNRRRIDLNRRRREVWYEQVERAPTTSERQEVETALKSALGKRMLEAESQSFQDEL